MLSWSHKSYRHLTVVLRIQITWLKTDWTLNTVHVCACLTLFQTHSKVMTCICLQLNLCSYICNFSRIISNLSHWHKAVKPMKINTMLISFSQQIRKYCPRWNCRKTFEQKHKERGCFQHQPTTNCLTLESLEMKIKNLSSVKCTGKSDHWAEKKEENNLSTMWVYKFGPA